jgi:hypothetical protein
MNPTKIAQALRLLADAFDDTTYAAATAAPAAPTTATVAAGATATAAATKRGPGRLSEASKKAAEAASAQSATSPATPPASASAAPSTASASNLTHAIVANDFKAAAAKHGRDFVVGLMKAHNAPTFDKVPVAALAAFQAALKAGPQAAPAGPADDLLG